MLIQSLSDTPNNEVIDLFREVFTASEGAQAGSSLEKLVSQLASHPSPDEVLGFGAFEDEQLRGAIYFSRLDFGDSHRVFMLSPVAVSSAYQRRGVGQKLITEGLAQLRTQGVEVVVTYGDPAYYGKFGFQAMSQRLISPPYPLSMPQGWLGLALSGESLPAIFGKPSCVTAFNDEALW